MFYKNLKTGEIGELIYSDNEFCIYVSLEEIEKLEGELNGQIFYGNKKTFKKSWKKAKVTCPGLEDETKKQIIDIFLYDRSHLQDENYTDRLILQTQLMYQ
jgi:hypothetical protein